MRLLLIPDMKMVESSLTEPSGHEVDEVMTYQKAAHRGVDLPEDVADHVESCHQAELQSIVDHHVDEHDVAGVLIEETGGQRINRS